MIRSAQAKLQEYADKYDKTETNEKDSNLQKFMTYKFGSTEPLGVIFLIVK